MITTLNTNLKNKIDKYNLTSSEVLTGETFLGDPVYTKLIDIGALPNKTSKTLKTGLSNANYIWIDITHSIAFNAGACYPIPYPDPTTPANAITARITNSGANIIVTTASNWSTYSAYIVIKYTKK